jgi:hypothetical protein
MLLIILAFAIMCISSFLFFRSNEQKNYKNNIKTIFTLKETELAPVFLEYEALDYNSEFIESNPFFLSVVNINLT